ncbi:MAG: Uma2 family endonuclease [Chloroflexi bacterium]|nr:MAG: Uma2 family endonuclease [Chloroflexota bacterium]
MTQQRLATVTAEATATNGSYPHQADWGISFVSESLYWEKYYDTTLGNYEWNNGQLEELPLSDYAKFRMYLWFFDLLRDYLYVHPLAKIMGLEMGFRLTLPNRVTIRKPDLGLVLDTNAVPLHDHDHTYHGIFDICLESISDSDQREIDRDAITKRDEYAAAGVQEYFLLDERGIETQFYRLVRRGLYAPLPRVNGIVHSQVLPGFQFRVADLYERPTAVQMVQDPVYNGFVSPLYRAERQRAEQAEARAEQERQRAEQERQRADDAEARTEQERQRAEDAQARTEQERQRAEQERQRAEQYAALLKAAGLLPSD